MTTTAKAPEPLAVIPRKDGEQIRVAWGEYNGHRFLDVRTYFRSADGEWLPTRKGVTLAPDQLDALADAIRKAKATAPRGNGR